MILYEQPLWFVDPTSVSVNRGRHCWFLSLSRLRWESKQKKKRQKEKQMNDFYFTWVCFFFFQSLNINIKKTVIQTEAVSNQFNCGVVLSVTPCGSEPALIEVPGSERWQMVQQVHQFHWNRSNWWAQKKKKKESCITQTSCLALSNKR